EFELVRVDERGAFQPAQDLRMRLVREDRRWYWRYDEGRGWNGGYIVEEELVEARTLSLPARQKLALTVGWGRYRLEILDPQTGRALRYRFYAGWGAQDADDVGNRPDRVQLKLEGAPYAAGAVAKLNVVPPHDGEALVTVEADRVLWTRRVPVKASGTTLEIPVDAAWNRHDLYVAVVAFRPGSQGDRVTPARALGLVHLPLARDARRLKVSIDAPAKTTPEQRVPVKLKLADAGGRPPGGGSAMVTLSAVDVGILNITRYASPDPAGFFFGKGRYEADLLDLYGRLIEKMDGGVARQKFGGDAAMRDSQSLPRRVRLVDLFSGPVAVDANGEATVPLNLPDFNGTLRLMAVAATADGYASADREMTVAAPLVAELAMPRFVSPGDAATVAMDLTNLSGAAQSVTVKLEADPALKLSGGPTGPVRLADGQRTVLRWTAEPTQADALAALKITATAGALKVVREAALQVQPPVAAPRVVRRVRIAPGDTLKLDPTLADGLWPGSTTVGLALSSSIPIDVRGALRGLLGYPYGCLEQTTSRAYPLVFLDEAGVAA
ncbi:MAG: alpha-2-macroglobulin family protein, partial [Burkholderiales bacterium]